MEKESVVSKVKKLFKLGNCKSATAAESASALAKAHRLMIQHKIEQFELDAGEDKEEEEVGEDEQALNMEDYGKSKLQRYKGTLAFILAKHNGCTVMAAGPVLKLFGKPSDMETVRYLYGYCVEEINRLVKLVCKGQGRTFANNFRYGCVTAIDKAIKEEQEELRRQAQADVNERSLIVIDSLALDHRKAKDYVRNNYRTRSVQTKHNANAKARALGEMLGQGIYKGKRAGAISD